MIFTQHLWESALPVYRSILDNLFIQELSNGKLPAHKFEFYIQQDALYLTDFGKALALLAVKAHNQADMLQFLQFAQGAIQVERSLHESYFQLFGITATHQKAPACFSYTNYLLATTALTPLEVGVAAVLPCFWIYREVGKHIWQSAAPGNPYQQWIDTYAGDEFDGLVAKMLEITNRMAAQVTEPVREQMREAFLHASRLEWYFWNDAYHLTTWSV